MLVRLARIRVARAVQIRVVRLPWLHRLAIRASHKNTMTGLSNGLNMSTMRITQSSSCTQGYLSLHVVFDVVRSKPSTRAARINSTSQDGRISSR